MRAACCLKSWRVSPYQVTLHDARSGTVPGKFELQAFTHVVTYSKNLVAC